MTPTEGAKPGGTVGAQRTMTATVEAIDPNVPSISFKAPNGWKYSRRVQDKAVLKDVKVGDRVDFTWTEAVQITVEAPNRTIQGKVEKLEEITLTFRGGEIVKAKSNRAQLSAGGTIQPCRGGGKCPTDAKRYCYYWFVGNVEYCRCLTCS